MKSLIITVGTRQVGWRCKDGVVRCLGADGDRGHPNHTQELFTRELGMERGFHGEQPSPINSWGVRYLGEQLHALCELNQDFSKVELLLDQVILDKEVEGLDQIILWGTNQPEDTLWKFRRADTVWVAKLMKGYIKQLYPNLEVMDWSPELQATNNWEKIYQTIEEFILNHIFAEMDHERISKSYLLIESKGSVPSIATALEMCAASLVRQCQVDLVFPEEPNPLFVDHNGNFTAQSSTRCSRLPMGRYFWPLEKPQIISAWERGAFDEARLWLTSHRDRFKPLYQLAEYLGIASNWDIKKAINQLQHQWLISRALKNKLTKEEQQYWQMLSERLVKHPKKAQEKAFWKWEGTFLLEVEISRQHYTLAFLRFAQLIEQLLYIQFESEEWLKKQYITPREAEEKSKEYKPGLGSLIVGWTNKNKLNETDNWVKLLKKIGSKRNGIVHSSEPLTLDESLEIFNRSGLSFNTFRHKTGNELLDKEYNLLVKISYPEWVKPGESLLSILYKWGLNFLNES